MSAPVTEDNSGKNGDCVDVQRSMLSIVRRGILERMNHTIPIRLYNPYQKENLSFLNKYVAMARESL